MEYCDSCFFRKENSKCKCKFGSLVLDNLKSNPPSKLESSGEVAEKLNEDPFEENVTFQPKTVWTGVNKENAGSPNLAKSIDTPKTLEEN